MIIIYPISLIVGVIIGYTVKSLAVDFGGFSKLFDFKGDEK